MSCPTCDGTMHALGCKVTGDNFFFCPRCGTIKPCTGEVVVPDLVRRCRLFHNTAILTGLSSRPADDEWIRHGVAESIWPEGSPGRLEAWKR